MTMFGSPSMLVATGMVEITFFTVLGVGAVTESVVPGRVGGTMLVVTGLGVLHDASKPAAALSVIRVCVFIN